MNKRETCKKAAFFGMILILMIVMIYSGLQILEATVFSKDLVEESTQGSYLLSIALTQCFRLRE